MRDKYDVIVIGSGLGGLLCANTLSMEGQKVLVLEKNNQIGGNLQIFIRNGVLFDTGVHYIGGLAKGNNLHKIFEYHGIMKSLELEEMDVNGFDRISFSGDNHLYPWAQGYSNFKEQLLKLFPAEEKALDAYIEKIKWACSRFPLYNLQNGVLNQSHELLTLNAHDFIESLSTNKKLKAVLAGNNFLYAGDPERTPFYVHALVCNSYIQSAHKIRGGGGKIAQGLAKSIRSYGGTIKRYQEVSKILTHNGKAIGVRTKLGKEYRAHIIISNAHPVSTYGWIDSGVRKITMSRLQALQNSVSAFSAHLVLKPHSIENFHHNIYHFKQTNVWNNARYQDSEWPKGIMISTPSERKNEKYARGISLLAYMNKDDLKPWENTTNTVAQPHTRGEDYDAFKNQKAQAMIEMMYEVLPQVKGNIEAVYTSSPLSYRDYIGSPDGSMYGILNDCNQPLATMLSPTTRIKGLYLTGQNLNLHGLLGVSMSAIKTCAEILGLEYLLQKINAH